MGSVVRAGKLAVEASGVALRPLKLAGMWLMYPGNLYVWKPLEDPVRERAQLP